MKFLVLWCRPSHTNTPSLELHLCPRILHPQTDPRPLRTLDNQTGDPRPLRTLDPQTDPGPLRTLDPQTGVGLAPPWDMLQTCCTIVFLVS